MLLYRYRRLDAAKEIAREHGYEGAMFAWESAGSGKEDTPDRAKDLDGKVIKIHTGKFEHHITADIAYAVYHYYNATHDEKFLLNYGYEVLFETARFWASRVQQNKRRRRYEIRHVIGPDEFHTDVDNNAFTNMMAKWNLITACKMFQKLRRSDQKACKALTERIKLTGKEVGRWKLIAANICIKSNRKQVIEQFDGYFKKKEVKITEWDENLIPVAPRKITPRDYEKTQLVKQADIIMLLHLLSDVFNIRTKRENYKYYLERTLHKSSLSLPIYAMAAIEVGDYNKAYKFFNTALHADVSNVNTNTADGIHAACMGGTWQVLIHGFAGVRMQKSMLTISPSLPAAWKRIIFSMCWRKRLFQIEAQRDMVKIRIISPRTARAVRIKVFGSICKLAGKRTVVFKRKKSTR